MLWNSPDSSHVFSNVVIWYSLEPIAKADDSGGSVACRNCLMPNEFRVSEIFFCTITLVNFFGRSWFKASENFLVDHGGDSGFRWRNWSELHKSCRYGAMCGQLRSWGGGMSESGNFWLARDCISFEAQIEAQTAEVWALDSPCCCAWDSGSSHGCG